jgi:hypothetical protein
MVVIHWWYTRVGINTAAKACSHAGDKKCEVTKRGNSRSHYAD